MCVCVCITEGILKDLLKLRIGPLQVAAEMHICTKLIKYPPSKHQTVVFNWTADVCKAVVTMILLNVGCVSKLT